MSVLFFLFFFCKEFFFWGGGGKKKSIIPFYSDPNRLYIVFSAVFYMVVMTMVKEV